MNRAARAVLVAASCAMSVGCGPNARPPARPAAVTDAATSRAADAGTTTGAGADAFPSLDAIAGRGPTEAPLMRELLRVEQIVARSADVRADRDLCLRALFAAPRAMRLWFADGAGAVRGEVASGASGAVPPRGPVCAKKGEVLHLVVEESEGSDTHARAVIFAAP